MRTVVKGKNIDVSEADRRHAEDKMRRLERLLDERSEALVELSLERHRSAEASHIVEVTLVVDGKLLRGEAGAATFRTAVDQVIDKLERQAVDLKERPRERERDADRRTRSDADDTSGSADEAPRSMPIQIQFAADGGDRTALCPWSGTACATRPGSPSRPRPAGA